MLYRRLLAPLALPFLALTAAALSGTRALCAEAGMDGYVSKPLDPAELIRALTSTDKGAKHASIARTPNETFDEQGFREAIPVSGLPGFIDLFLEDLPGLLKELKLAVEHEDGGEVAECAHTLRGLAANYMASRAYECAGDLERAAAAEDLDSVKRQLPDLANELDELSMELRRVRESL